nr:hypothetical protein [Endozoicomonas sp.]
MLLVTMGVLKQVGVTDAYSHLCCRSDTYGVFCGSVWGEGLSPWFVCPKVNDQIYPKCVLTSSLCDGSPDCPTGADESSDLCPNASDRSISDTGDSFTSAFYPGATETEVYCNTLTSSLASYLISGAFMFGSTLLAGKGLYNAYKWHRDLDEPVSCQLICHGLADVFRCERYRQVSRVQEDEAQSAQPESEPMVEVLEMSSLTTETV